VQKALSDGRAIKPRVKRLKHNLKCHILSVENVASKAQRVSRQNATWMRGRGLSLFAETSVSSRLGGVCTVPSSGVDQSQSQHMVGPLKGTHGKKVKMRRCQDEASPR